MKLLFVHQNFPGQFLHIVRDLAIEGGHDLVFLTEPNNNIINGVRRVPYAKPAPPPTGAHWSSREFEEGMRRADVVQRTAQNLRALGFVPDIIIGHHGWGELLNLPDVFPGVPMLGYLEFFYRTHGQDVGFDPEFPAQDADYPRIRAKNAVNHLALDLHHTVGARGQTPTEWQLATYPEWARPGITLLREGVDVEMCRPDPAAFAETWRVGEMTIDPSHKLITYVARDLEPYRGFHVVLRALPRILNARPDARVVLVGGDGVSYGATPSHGSWREIFLAELGASLDLSRVVLPGKVSYEVYTKLLRRSDAHVYLTYPFVASWSLREAMATGCVVVASDTAPVREFVTHERTGLLTPFHDSAALADRVLEALEDTRLARRLRTAARAYAERRLDVRDTIAGYRALIDAMTGGGLSAAKPKLRRAKRA